MFLVSFKHNEKAYENFDISKEEIRQQLVEQGIDVEAIAKAERKKQLSEQTDNYFYTEAENRGGYKNMGEILYDTQEGDPDAQFLKSLYDAIWTKEEELEQIVDSMTIEELLNLDVQKICKEAYDQVKAELETTSE